MIGQFVGTNREQVPFQRPALVIIGQAGQESDKGLLNNVRSRTITKTKIEMQAGKQHEPGSQRAQSRFEICRQRHGAAKNFENS